MRVAKAQSELAEGDDEGDDEKEKESAAKQRAKYDIPEGVHLFLDAALTKYNAKACKPHLAAFVKGKLTKNGMSNLIFYFEEYAQCDYGWILVERPMGFYDQPSDEDMDDVRREIESIGTRSRSKNTKLPRIAGVFSLFDAPEQLSPRLAAEKEAMEKAKSNGVQTHHAPHAEPPWIAICMPAVCKMLEGYGLTEEEKTDLVALMAGYCRLIDEAGLIGYGHAEIEAILNIPNDKLTDSRPR